MQARPADWREVGVCRHVCLCSNCETVFGLKVKICSPNVFGLGSVRAKECSNQEVPLYKDYKIGVVTEAQYKQFHNNFNTTTEKLRNHTIQPNSPTSKMIPIRHGK